MTYPNDNQKGLALQDSQYFLVNNLAIEIFHKLQCFPLHISWEKKNFTAAFAEHVFNQIRGFGEYGFPESHADVASRRPVGWESSFEASASFAFASVADVLHYVL